MKKSGISTWAALAVVGLTALISNLTLFRQEVQGHTELTRKIPGSLGSWYQVDEYPATPGEVQGLETSDVTKRIYSNGRDDIELVVAYIAHSSRKSAHAQEACLRGSGALVSNIHTLDLRQAPVRAKSIAMDYHGQKQRIYYWYKIGNLHTSDYLHSSLRMFLGGFFGKQGQGASLVRLMTTERKGETDESVNGRLEDFTSQLLPHLEKILP